MNTLTQTQVRLYASAQSWIEGEAVRQLYAASKLDGTRLAVGFPDLHPDKGGPVGAAYVTEGVIYPHLIGGDIACGMALFKTDLLRRDAKLQRWANLPFDEEGVDEALRQLEAEEPRKAELVKLRFFAGLTAEQAADAIGVSTSTAEKDWAYARSWLRVAIDRMSGHRP